MINAEMRQWHYKDMTISFTVSTGTRMHRQIQPMEKNQYWGYLAV
jgi:hypothetical protein